jgi:hypothetical protein
VSDKNKSASNTKHSTASRPVRLVRTSSQSLLESCNGAEAGSKLPYAEKPAGRKALQPGLKGWLDGVILPILIGDIFHDNSGEFNSRGITDAIRYIRALFFKPAVARVDC